MVAFSSEFVVLAIGYVLAFIGVTNDKFRIMKYLGSFLIMAVSVTIISVGITGFNNLLTITIGYMSMAVGFFFLVQDFMSFDKQSETFEEIPEEDGRFHDND